jgi:hypothetical protein
LHALFISDWRLFCGFKFLKSLWIITKIQFGSDKNDWCVGTVFRNFRIPPDTNIFERFWEFLT